MYGFRISILFGFILTFFSMVIGVSAGAVQGYFGGLSDLLGQRFLEIWSGIPVLYLIIIIGSIIIPSFWSLLFLLLLFSWMTLVGLVRAEFLKARNFDYVKAARCLGMTNGRIMFKHILPNAMVSTITFLPFIMDASITTLTSLDLSIPSDKFYNLLFENFLTSLPLPQPISNVYNPCGSCFLDNFYITDCA